MILKKSPGGSIFPYYYKNGELFGAHYESFAGREQGLIERMRAEEEFFVKQNYPLPFWVNFYGTMLTTKYWLNLCRASIVYKRIFPDWRS